jgi:hypothetical protein
VTNYLDILLATLRQMEATLFRLQELRNYVGEGVAKDMLGAVIQETETHLEATKRKLIQ